MLKLCHTKMILPPHPYSPAPKKNIPSLSFLKLILDNNCSVKPFMGKWSLEAWNKQVTRPSIVSKSLGTSLRYQVPKIFPLLSTLYFLAGVAGKLCIHFSQCSETVTIMLQRYWCYPSIMPDAPDIVLCSKLCWHNPTDPTAELLVRNFCSNEFSKFIWHAHYINKTSYNKFQSKITTKIFTWFSSKKKVRHSNFGKAKKFK